MTTELKETSVISFDPFDGDFGGTGDRTLKDKLGKARKTGPCHLCNSEIQKGEVVRLRTDISYGEIMSFRWCNLCCVAMQEYEDNGDDTLIDARYKL